MRVLEADDGIEPGLSRGGARYRRDVDGCFQCDVANAEQKVQRTAVRRRHRADGVENTARDFDLAAGRTLERVAELDVHRVVEHSPTTLARLERGAEREVEVVEREEAVVRIDFRARAIRSRGAVEAGGPKVWRELHVPTVLGAGLRVHRRRNGQHDGEQCGTPIQVTSDGAHVRKVSL